MKIAYILFDGVTFLDFIGIYDPISRLKSMNFIPHLTWDVCGLDAQIRDSFALKLNCDKVKNNLAEYEMVVVPGGLGTRLLSTDQSFIEWLQTARKATYMVSVCTGSLLLGAAGFLKDKQATTHFDEYQTLQRYCMKVLPDRIVEDGNSITAGAVSSSIDLGLYLCEKLAGRKAREIIRERMDYHGLDCKVHKVLH